jgi:hypothetical protein
MTYLRNVVICTYRALHPDVLDISQDRLEKLDESLRNTYDDEMRKQANDNGIATTNFNLSMLMFFSAQSTAQAVTTQVRHGCKFFLSIGPLP